MKQKIVGKLSENTAYMRKYRAKHRRFDYVPSDDALAAIENHKSRNKYIAGVIDELILAGSEAISGNSKE